MRALISLGGGALPGRTRSNFRASDCAVGTKEKYAEIGQSPAPWQGFFEACARSGHATDCDEDDPQYIREFYETTPLSLETHMIC